MTDLENREAFEKWHFLRWKLHNAVTDTVDFAKVLYDRVYSHDHTSSVREVEFNAWQASTQREGFKFVPVETLEECLSWAACASSESWSDEQRDEIDKHYKVIEKAMIGEETK